ncbi:hypothetical protein EP342_00050, partial [bacterium]
MKKLAYFFLISFLLVAGIGIAEAATHDVTINLKNSSGSAITTGAVLKYYDSGNWHNAVDNGDGSFTASVNGTSVMYSMTYNYTSQTITSAGNPVDFQTSATKAVVKNSGNIELTGGTYSFYGIGGWHYGYASGTSLELLPGNYSFAMNYNNSGQQKNGQTVSGTSSEIVFTTTTVTPRLLNCSETEDIANSTFTYYGYQGWKASQATNTSIELLPGNISFSMTVNGTSQQTNNIAISGPSQDIKFYATLMNYVYSGNITYYANGWRTLTQGMYLLPGTYYFKFGNQTFPTFAVSGCEMNGNVNIFITKQSDGTALPNIPIYRNDYGTHFQQIGTTDANGILFTTNLPSPVKTYRASKNYSNQDIVGSATTFNFQSCRFISNVKHTDDTPFEGVATYYNDYGTHYLFIGNTDANGNAYIELFKGEFNFRAWKNYSSQDGSLELNVPGTTGTVNFKTSTYKVHVKDHSGADLAGVTAQYNDYGTHWMNLSPATTDANGNASIELFPSVNNFHFRAWKNYTSQEGDLVITTSGLTGTVEFQTALAQGFAKDCELGTGVAGIRIQFNDYGSHWMDLNPNSTAGDGLASIELFPGGPYNMKASTIYTSKTKSFTLAGPTTQVEFNPVRVSLNYAGTVKYNDYGTHWMTMNANTYMFPGTYDFRFYTGNTLNLQQSITIAEVCSVNQALIFVQLKDSYGNGLSNGDFDYRIGWNNYNNLGIDASGNGYWAFVSGNPTNIEVKAKYHDASVTKIQNIQVNPVFTFNTVNVKAKLMASDNVTEITPVTNWEYRIGWQPYQALNNLGEEILPVNVEVRVSYKDATKTMIQNVGTSPNFTFNTKKVTANLLASDNSTDLSTSATWEYRIGWQPYQPLTSGEEMLPVNVEVRVGYKDALKSMIQNVGTTPDFTFNTVKVTSKLMASDNVNEITTGTNWEYRIGWQPYHPLTIGEEMLPVNVEVKLGYKDAINTKIQNVGTTPDFTFNTVSVTADLFQGATDLSSSATWQYRIGWQPYQTLTLGGEDMLPGNVEVKATYGSSYKTKIQNVGTAKDFHFTYDGNVLGKSANEYDFTANKVSIYPNPSDGKFILDNIKQYNNLTIFDL